jgi:hypothetical protein
VASRVVWAGTAASATTTEGQDQVVSLTRLPGAVLPRCRPTSILLVGSGASTSSRMVQQPAACVVGRHGIEVLPYRYPRMGIDPCIQQSCAVGRLGRKRKQRGLLSSERGRHGDRSAPMTQLSSVKSAAATFSLNSVSDATVGTGTMCRRRSLPISPSTPPFSWAPSGPGIGEERVEAVVTAQRDESVRFYPIVPRRTCATAGLRLS